MGFTPTYDGSSLKLYIGTWGRAQAVAGSTTLSLAVFPVLPGQSSAIVFEPSDVGNPIFIGGAGPVDPLTPSWYYTQGGPFHTTILTYISPSEVILAAAPTTSYYNTGVNNITLYRPCEMVLDSVQFTSSISPGTRDQLQFSTLQQYAYFVLNQAICLGQPVYLTSIDPAVGDIFGGLIDSLVISNQMQASGGGTVSIGSGLSEPSVAAGVVPFSYSVACASWDQIATRRVVQPERATSYSNMDSGAVMNTIIVTHLNDESVAFENDIPAASLSPYSSGLPVIDFAVSAGAYVSDLLNQLVSQMSTPTATYFWYTDEWKTIHLSERSVSVAPWNVDQSAASDGNILVSVNRQLSHNLLANNTYVVATAMLTISFQTTFQGNGTATSFNVSNPIEAPPSIYLNGTPQTVGVANIDTGMQWYWSQGSTAITQGSGAILTSSDQLLVNYQSSTPGVGEGFNNVGLTQLEATEGMGAIYQSSTQYSKPVSQAQLLAYAEALAVVNGVPAEMLAITTLKPGIFTGQAQTINLYDVGADAAYLISAVTMTTTDNVITWNYTAVNGSNIGFWWTGWVNFINRSQYNLLIAQATQPVVSAENTITIHHSKVVGGDKTNYVFGFLGTYNFLELSPTGFVAYANGSDIYFSTTQDRTGLLDFDLTYYDSTTGQIAAWVRIPVLSSTVDTVIYIMYGDVTQLTSLANPPGVWSSVTDVSGTPNPNYHGVYHLNESAAPFHDSSKYANNATGPVATYPTLTSGPFGYAGAFPQTGDGTGLALPSLFDGNGFSNYSGTMQAWVKTTHAPGYWDAVFDARNSESFDPWGTGQTHGFAICTRNLLEFNPPAYGWFFLNFDGNIYSEPDPVTEVSDGNWHRISVTMSPTQMTVVVDGDTPYVGTVAGQNFAMQNKPCLIGSNIESGTQEGFTGDIAECWATQVVKDAGTIATEWNNQSSPSTFYTISTGTVGPVPPPPIPTQGNPSANVSAANPLTNGDPVIGLGGSAIGVGTKTGSTTEFVTASGAASSGDPLIFDSSGNAEAGSAGQLVPAGGTSGQSLMKNSGTDYDTHWSTPAGGGTVTNSGTLTGDEPVFGAGTTVIKVGTKQGSTDEMQCASGAAGATGAPLTYDASGNAVAGVTGQFVPAGGTTGEVLAKSSNSDYATTWAAAGTGTVTNDEGALTIGEPVIGNSGADVQVGTKQGNTTEFQCATGAAGGTGTPLLYDANGNAVAGTRQGNTTKYQAASGSAGSTGAPLLYDANGNAVAGTTGQLVPAGGTTGQALVKNSNTDNDTKWGTVSGSGSTVEVNGAGTLTNANLNNTTPAAGGGGTNVTFQVDGSGNVSAYYTGAGVSVNTKGDLQGYDTAPDRVPVGSNGQVLTADSTQSLGLKWATPSSSAVGLLWSGSGPPAIPSYSIRQSTKVLSENPTSLAYGSSIVSGNLLVAVVGRANGELPNGTVVSTTAEGSWTQRAFAQFPYHDGVAIYTAVAASSGSRTANFSGINGSAGQAIIMEITGNWTTTVDASGDSTSAPALPLMAAYDLMLTATYYSSASAVTVTSPEAIIQNTSFSDRSMAVAWVAPVATGSQTSTLAAPSGTSPSYASVALLAASVSSPGNNGDWYIDLTTGHLWSKSGGVWSDSGYYWS